MDLHTLALSCGLMSNVAPLSLFSKVGFLTAPIVIIIAGSDVDKSCPLFWKAINYSHSPGWLKGMNHCVVGNTFISDKMLSLGSKEIFKEVTNKEADLIPLFQNIFENFPVDDGVRPSAVLPRAKKPTVAASGAPAKVAKVGPEGVPTAREKQPTPPPPVPAAAVPSVMSASSVPVSESSFIRIDVKLERKGQRLGAQWTQKDDSSEVFVSSVKAGSLFAGLGIQAGLKVEMVNGVVIEGEIILQRQIDQMRSNLGGVIEFSDPNGVIESDDEDMLEVADERSAVAAPSVRTAKPKIIFLFASQTGNAEAISHEIEGEIRAAGYPTELGRLNEYEKHGFGSPDSITVFVISTTGDGEIPDNGKKFLRMLKKKPESVSKNLTYAILALGDQNYDRFCFAGKTVDKILKGVGCGQICDIGCADDGCGLEIVVEPWRVLFKESLEKYVQTAPPPVTTAEDSSMPPPSSPLVAANKRNINDRRLLIMYGSQTGNSEAIARGLAEVANENDVKQKLVPANKYKSVDWESYSVVILVMSTTGDGEYSDNSGSFGRFLSKPHPDGMLKGMKYTLLALGDQNYPNFCAAGKKIDKRMSELGAERFYNSGFADDGVGLEVVVEPWKQKLWPALLGLWADTIQLSPQIAPLLRKVSPLQKPLDLLNPPTSDQRTSDRASSDVSSYYEIRHGQCNPFYAKVHAWENMTRDTELPTYRVTLDVSESQLEWTPGDAIGVLPCNNDAAVDYVLQRLGVQPLADFPRPRGGATADRIKRPIYDVIRFPLTNRQVLLRHVDLVIRKMETLRFLAAHCKEKQDRDILAEWSTSSKLFRDRVLNRKLTLCDILSRFDSCQADFKSVIEACSVLQPRYYSVASAREVNPHLLDFCFHMVTHRVGDKKIPGVCTSWMESLLKHRFQNTSDIAIPIFLKTTPEFSVPEDLSHPVIMIGPGAGVAPFVSFLQHRQVAMQQEALKNKHLVQVPAVGGAASVIDIEVEDAQQKSLTHLQPTDSKVVGETHLFFGCKHHNTDYIFKEELEGFVNNQTLRYLHTAFSQEEDDAYWYGGVYVQDKMMDISGRLATLIQSRNAYIYVCGDAKSMAKDVHRVLIEILVESKRMTSMEANEMLAELQSKGRYQRDLW
eukprot:TRINITY_DN1899_c0_g2_i1.p1 TRINITY_DN1899_c0_g2~~TRINITY_DN1899_c0_g2_i1.p1  ORF type:complete len:1173 (+),score=231.07 TRINITY_DN1899_c0_g2_i1:139-3519(+)